MKVKQLVAHEGERCFVVVLDSGEEATKALLSFAEQHHVQAGSFTGIGALAKLTLGFFDLARKEYLPIEIAEQVELISMIGNFAVLNDNIRLHCHVVVANRQGHAFGGHLLKAVVRPTLEVVVNDVPAHLRRRTDAATGLALLTP